MPYRDSKLTRLLQESLGGNSRTTLVINCSPSSYNDSETLSTLRFGMRAKKIENKAKVNQELSASELRKQLDIARRQINSFQKLVTAMENELLIWRSGELPLRSFAFGCTLHWFLRQLMRLHARGPSLNHLSRNERRFR